MPICCNCFLLIKTKEKPPWTLNIPVGITVFFQSVFIVRYLERAGSMSCCFFTLFSPQLSPIGVGTRSFAKTTLLLLLTLMNLTSPVFLNKQLLRQLNNSFFLKPLLPLASRALRLSGFLPIHLRLFLAPSMWKQRKAQASVAFSFLFCHSGPECPPWRSRI